MSIAPTLTAERFLQASNVRDLEEMSRLFGTYDGPIGDTGNAFGCFWKKLGSVFDGSSCRKWTEVELRMDLISSILQHQDYQAVSERMVSGAEHPANRTVLGFVIAPCQVRASGASVLSRTPDSGS